MSSRGRRNRIIALTILVITMFLIGMISGMLIVHFANLKKQAKEETNQQTANTDRGAQIEIVKEESEEGKIINVYVPERIRQYGVIPRNPYNTENFRIEDGFMAYFNEEGEKISHLGVDLSYHQTKVDWQQLKDSGCEFVMLRCGYRGYTEGGLVKDEKFDEYAAACNEYDIPMGVYFFTQAISVEEAEREAEFVLSLIEDYEISYPVAFDTENVTDKNARTNINEITKELRSNMCIAFCEKVKEAGYYPMIYASENWIRRNMDVELLQEYDFWAPQYLEENDFMYDFTMWQYTEKGDIAGIEGEVDLNVSLVDYSQFVPNMRQAVLSGGEIKTIPSEQEEVSAQNEEGSEELKE